MEKSIVRISNLLNFTRQEFDVYEQRLLALTLEKLKMKQGMNLEIDTSRNLEISLNYSDFEQDLTSNRLKKLAETVTSRKLYYQSSENKWTYLVLFPIVSYDNGELKITIIDKALVYLLELAKGYTNINKQSIFSLRSTISIRMYELLSSYLNHGMWNVELNDLREFLNLKHNQYINFKDFRRRILIYSQKELWEHCNLHFEWEIAAKKGKKITAITFYIKEREKQEAIELNEEIIFTQNFIANLSPADIAQKIRFASERYALTEQQVNLIAMNAKLFNEFIRVDLVIENMIAKGKPPKDRTKYLAKALGFDKIKFPKNIKKEGGLFG